MIGWSFNKSEDDNSDEENRHWASSEEDCKFMEKKYGWKLKKVEQNEGDSDSGVDCVFKGKQTSFWDMSTTAHLLTGSGVGLNRVC